MCIRDRAFPTELFGRGGGDAHVFDVNAQGMGKVGAHGIAVRGDLGLLTGNGAIGIDKLKAQLARVVHHAGEQHHRISTLVGRIGVGE